MGTYGISPAARQSTAGIARSSTACRLVCAVRDKKGRVRREIFARLRTTKFLRAKSDQDSAAVEFTGRVARLGRVHQDGAEDRVAKGGPRARYPKRELPGYTSGDLRIIRESLVKRLVP